MVDQAIKAGALRPETEGVGFLDPERRAEAESQATTIAMALSESRVRVEDLRGATPGDSQLRHLYEARYPASLQRAGLEAIELVDRFPILTGSFGYTRGQQGPGASRLVPFKDRGRNYALYADITNTEALFVRLSPKSVLSWLKGMGFNIPDAQDAREARVSILGAAEIPLPGEEVVADTVGSALLTLIHSYAHRFIRLTALYAGIERSALSELLVPVHSGFFVYSSSRGDFVLGGLQALFETELDRFLDDFANGDYRCALDPGCRRGGGACMACLHLGEPSCRYYNRFLDRATLSGPRGFLTSHLGR
jgi:hypothetical protein